jgi:hypothetical protein
MNPRNLTHEELIQYIPLNPGVYSLRAQAGYVTVSTTELMLWSDREIKNKRTVSLRRIVDTYFIDVNP